MPTLTIPEAKRFYDRFGRTQDRQDFYEAPAIESLLASGDFARARSVFELGCGTGRLAQRLLRDCLPATSTYRGVDISSTMIAIATDRLAGFGERAKVSIESGESELPARSRSVDRFLATYVFDLLSDEQVRSMLSEAHRILVPDGLLCIAGLTPGTTALSRMVMALWSGLFRLRPLLVGGCRPIRLGERLGDRWQIEHREVVVAFGIASEVLVARRR